MKKPIVFVRPEKKLCFEELEIGKKYHASLPIGHYEKDSLGRLYFTSHRTGEISEVPPRIGKVFYPAET